MVSKSSISTKRTNDLSP